MAQVLFLGIAIAAPVVDNNSGTWSDDFSDQLGTVVLESPNVDFDVFTRSVSLGTGQSSGQQTSVVISPPAFDAWEELCLEASFPDNAALSVTILDPNNGNIAIPGFTNIDMGGFDGRDCLDLSSLSATTYPEIKVQINHTRTGGLAPTVRELQVSWNPRTVVLFDKVGPETVEAGKQFGYQVRLSANFVNARQVVVWDTLPDLARGSILYEAGEEYPAERSAANQHDEPVVATVSEGGTYTATATTVSSVGGVNLTTPVNVPANSVYWTFDELEAGNSIILQVFLQSPNGTLDGTLYRNNANVYVENGDDRVAEEVETRVLSEPSPQLTKADATTTNPAQTRVFPLNGENYIIPGNELTFRLRDPFGPVDGNDFANEGRERMYNTVLYDNLLPFLDPNNDGFFDDSLIELAPQNGGANIVANHSFETSTNLTPTSQSVSGLGVATAQLLGDTETGLDNWDPVPLAGPGAYWIDNTLNNFKGANGDYFVFLPGGSGFEEKIAQSVTLVNGESYLLCARVAAETTTDSTALLQVGSSGVLDTTVASISLPQSPVGGGLQWREICFPFTYDSTGAAFDTIAVSQSGDGGIAVDDIQLINVTDVDPAYGFTGSGTYSTTAVTIGTTTVPAYSVYWDLDTFDPGDDYTEEFKVRLKRTVLDGTRVTNTAYLDSDQTERLEDPLPMLVERPIGGCFCKLGYFPHYLPREQDANCTEADGAVPILVGDPVEYRINLTNCGVSPLVDVVFFDRVPDEVDFTAASLRNRGTGMDITTSSGTTIWYYTNTDFNDPEVRPPFGVGNPGANGWTSTVPNDLSTVQWVAWHLPFMESHINDPGNPASRAYARMDTVVKDPVDPCSEYWITNWGLIDVFSHDSDGDGNGDIVPDDLNPFRSYKADDLTRVRPPLGEFYVDSDTASLTPVTIIPGNSNYTVQVRNESIDFGTTGLDTFTDVEASLQLSQVEVNGVATYPTILGINGATITNFDPGNGLIEVSLGRSLAPGETADIDLELTFPLGTLNNSEYTVTATLRGIDDSCLPYEAVIQSTGVVTGAPVLQVNKDDVLNVIPGGGTIDYRLNYRNIGTSTSENTWVVDRIPFKTVFLHATAPQGEEVWFTDKLPPEMPANQISVLDPVDFSVISQNFTPGILNDNSTPGFFPDDSYTSPFGEATTWIAYKVDDAALSPPRLRVTSSFQTVGFTVRNDEDASGGQTDSPEGTVIFNEEVIFSDTNLQAVGNEVRTTIEDFPGLQLEKSSDKEVVTSSESFNWIITYSNNSTFADDVVTITDTLPSNVNLNSVSHQWNATAISNNGSLPIGSIDISNDANVTLTYNGDGTTLVEVRIAGSPGLKSGLAQLEGGTITINVTPVAGTPSGTEALNVVQGFASNSGGVTIIDDTDLVSVANPDVTINKIASRTDPGSGDTVTFTIVLANQGLNDATGVSIDDVLPAGMSFVEGSTQILSAGWTISDDPEASDTTLNWSSLTPDGGSAGTIPAGTSAVYFSYQAVVTGNAGDSFDNTVSASLNETDDDPSNNSDIETTTIPFPDPSVTISGPDVVQAGGGITWTVQFRNETNNSAEDVYLIQTLPHFSNTAVDLSFDGVLLPDGVTGVFYSSEATEPAFDSNNPTGSGLWVSSPSSPVRYIAYVVGTLPSNAAPQSILVTTSIPGSAPKGQNYPTSVEIFTSSTENDDPGDPDDGPANNNDSTTTRVPGADVRIDQEIDATFSVRPGDPATYTITVTNVGTEPAVGVRVVGNLPSNFIPDPLAFNGLTQVEATNSIGEPVPLIDEFGDDLTIPVSGTMTGSPSPGAAINWYLGVEPDGSTDEYYQEVGIPVGGQVSFTFQGTIDPSAADGDTVLSDVVVHLDVGTEDNLANNTDSVVIPVRRPELLVGMSVMNDSDGSEVWTEACEYLTYTIDYNNVGNADADNVVIRTSIPPGSTYVTDSLMAPDGSSVSWDPNQANPSGFEVRFDSLPAPASFDGIPGYGTGTKEDPFTDIAALGSAATGTYWFNIGGKNFQGYVDGETDGGGWLMILNYVHEGSTNPDLQVRTEELPLYGSNTLGDDESGTANWGHASNTLAALLDFDTLLFQAETSGHSRTVNFRTSDENQIGTSYVKTGSGSFNNLHLDPTWRAMTGHTATIPGGAQQETAGQGDLALTELPFFDNGNANWGIRAGGTDWEVDDTGAGFSNDTIHRVFVRKTARLPGGTLACLQPVEDFQVGSTLSEITPEQLGDHWMHVDYDANLDNDDGTTIDPVHRRDLRTGAHAVGDIDGDGVIDYVIGSERRDLDELVEDNFPIPATNSPGAGTNTGGLIITLMNADGTVKSIVEIGAGENDGGFLTPDSNAPEAERRLHLEAQDFFGRAVEPIGDADGDGVPDIAVGATGKDKEVTNNTSRGAVYFIYLNADGTVKNATQIMHAGSNSTSGTLGGGSGIGDGSLDDPVSAQLGASLSFTPDFDGNGTPVLVAGDRQIDISGAENSGGYFLMFLATDGDGNLTGEVDTFVRMQPGRDPDYLGTGDVSTGDEIGWDIAFIGDVDSNGVQDMVVTASRDDDGYSNAGAAYLILNEADGTVKGYTKISTTSPNSPALDAEDKFGTGAAALGDIDGDGIPDFAVSAPDDDDGDIGNANRGAIYLFFPNSDGSIREFRKIGQQYGNGPGDINGVQIGARLNSYDIDDDGDLELLVGTQVNAGVNYITDFNNNGNFNPGNATNPEFQFSTNPIYDDTTQPGVPVFHDVIKGGGADDPAVFVIELVNNSGHYETAATFDFPISSTGTLSAWDELFISEEAPEGTTITYELRDANDTTTLFGPVEITDGSADISSIGVANTSMILRVAISSVDSTKQACLNAFKATYVTTESPNFTFQVKVDDPVPAGQITVDNVVTIETSTPEILDNVSNNVASDSINIRLTDIAVTSTVDKSSVVGASDETISYALNWEVFGPQAAINARLVNVLPPNVAYTPGSASIPETSLDTNYQGSGRTALVWDIDTLDANTGDGETATGEAGTITFIVTETNAATNDILTNSVIVTNDRQETDTTNNADNEQTVVGNFANVALTQTVSDTVFSLNGTGTYTITYTNNGNVPAANVTVSDTLPPGVTIGTVTDSVDGAITPSGNGFTHNAGTFPVGETRTITVTFTVDNTPSLVGTTITNTATVSTTTTETDLGDNADSTNITVQLLSLSSLSGMVFLDADRTDGDTIPDGENLDVGESGIEGVTITLTGTDIFNDPVNLTTTTDESGRYGFSGLNPGTYNVSESQPQGYLSTATEAGDVINTNTGATTEDTGTTGSDSISSITLAAGERGVEFNFGEVLATVGDTVWIDDNRNGLQDLNEPGLANVGVQIYDDTTNSLVASAVTDSQGEYLFDMLPEGGFYVVFDYSTLPAGFTPTTQNAGDDDLDSDADVNTGRTPTVTLAAGAIDLSLDLGLVAAYDFGDLMETAAVKTTLEADGARHVITGNGLALGAIVDIDPNGAPNPAADGDDKGRSMDEEGVSFGDLAAGVSGTVLVDVANPTLRPAYLTAFIDWNDDGDFDDSGETVASALDAGTASTTLELALTPPVEAITGRKLATRFRLSSDPVAPGANGVARDGEVEDHLIEIAPAAGMIGNFVWLDEDGNGLQDAGEPGIPNVVVHLYDPAGTLLDSTATDTNGGYSFGRLPSGDYFVDVDENSFPVGMSQTVLTNAGAEFGNQDQGTDVPNNDYGYPVSIGGSDPIVNTTADFGYNWNPVSDVTGGTNTAALGDRVWIDGNGNGIQDSGEIGVEGVELSLYNDPDLDGTFDSLVSTTVSDAAGNYIFDGLSPDAYSVVVTADSGASHAVLGSDYAQTGDPDHFAAGGGTNDHQTTVPVLLGPGDVFLNVDFGYEPQPSAALGSIGDLVWLDLDADGTLDAGETGIPGVSIALISDANGNGRWDVTTESIVATDVTDGSGGYAFENLLLADYVVAVNDTDGVLAGLDQSSDNDGILLTPNQSAVTISGGTPDDTAQDFGYTPGKLPGSIGDTIWADLDNSGTSSPDAGEPGLGGVTVNLYVDVDTDGAADDLTGNSFVDAADILATEVTDANGFYLFDSLPLGGYVVEVDTATIPVSYNSTSSYEETAGNESTAGNGTSDVLLTAVRPSARDQDFSYPPVASNGIIGDTIWADDNGNGSQDGGEFGIPGVVVNLLDTGGNLIESAVSDANGAYVFDELPFGDYTVSVDVGTLPAGYDSAPSGDPENDNNSTSAATLSGGSPTNLVQDFGYQPLVSPVGSIGDAIYVDLDGGGSQGNGEPGIPGVGVDLYDGTTYLASTVTDEDGKYVFGGIDPDNSIVYTVLVDLTTLPATLNPVATQSGSDGGTDNFSSLSLATTDPSTRNDTAQDFGFQPAVQTGSIGDYVWLDADSLGDQDETSAGIPGVLVELLDESGRLIATEETGEDGFYLFAGLSLDDGTGAAGADYTVRIASSNFTAGAVLEGMSNTFDSDADMDNFGAVVTITAASPDNSAQDFGYVGVAPGSIGNLVWNDTNADGVKDPAETGMDGVTLTLHRDADGNGLVDPDDMVLQSTTTSGGGAYSFDGLPSGDYIVAVTDESGVLGGSWHSLGTPATDDNSQADPYAIAGLAGGGDVTADFGYYNALAAVGNHVWNDANGNGIQDSGELPIGNVDVTLTVVFPNNDVITVATATDINGFYSFGNLLVDENHNALGPDPEPDHSISVATPAGFFPTIVDATTATDFTDSDLHSGVLATLVQGETDVTAQSDPATEPAIASYDFGFYVPYNIRGEVRDDIDEDGSLIDNDRPVGGVTVVLYRDSNNDGVPQASEQIATAVTATDGTYEFTNVSNGSYLVTEQDPAGSVSSGDADTNPVVNGNSNANLIAVTVADADSENNDFLDAIDPSGYLYDSSTGEILPGGMITVNQTVGAPTSINVTQDGSSGQYAFEVGGPGTFVVGIAASPTGGYFPDLDRPDSGTFNPAPGAEPISLGSYEDSTNGGFLVSAEAVDNVYYLTFELEPGDPLILNNNLPFRLPKGRQFSEFVTDYGLTGNDALPVPNGSNEGGNPDGDRSVNLTEYALCLHPGTGLETNEGFCAYFDVSTDNLNARFTRPGGITDVTYTLEAIGDLLNSPAGWFDVTTITPVILDNGNGSETVTFPDLESIAGLTTSGNVRLRMDLDTDGDAQTAEATSYSEVFGWSCQTAADTQCRTVSDPYLSKPIFIGWATTVSGQFINVGGALTAGDDLGAVLRGSGEEYVLEVTTGACNGHRFDIDETNSTATVIAITTSSPFNTKTLGTDLEGATLVVRPHRTIADLNPPAEFNLPGGGDAILNADRLLFYDALSGLWVTYALVPGPVSGNVWTDTAISNFDDDGARIIDPCAGWFFHPKNGAVTMKQVGMVRDWSFSCPLEVDYNLVGSGYPVDQSFDDRAMTVAGGFVGSNSQSSSDRVHIWNGDRIIGASGYDGHFFIDVSLNGTDYEFWTSVANSNFDNENASLLFGASEAAYYQMQSAHPTWVIPPSWSN